jgi:hypothetical protein
MVPDSCGHSSVGRASASQADLLPSKRAKYAEWLASQCATGRHDTPQIATSSGDLSGDRFRALLALVSVLSTACTPLADRACDEFDVVIDGSRLAIDLNALDDGCGPDPLLRFVTIAPGSLELDGCTHLDEPERYACGLSFRFICPAGDLDNAGTPGTWEVVGHVGIDDPRDGPVGLADVTLWAEHGTDEAWQVCTYQAEVDAWPLVAE